MLTDLPGMPRWVEGLREARPVTPGPLRTGSRLVEVREERGGKVRELPLEVEAFEPPRRMVRSAATPAGRFTYTYTLEPAPEGTRFTLRGEARPATLVERLVLALAWGTVQAKDARIPERLKALVESG